MDRETFVLLVMGNADRETVKFNQREEDRMKKMKLDDMSNRMTEHEFIQWLVLVRLARDNLRMGGTHQHETVRTLIWMAPRFQHPAKYFTPEQWTITCTLIREINHAA